MTSPAATTCTTMAAPIGEEDFHLLPLIKMVAYIGRDLMYWVFCLGCPNKDPAKTLEDYLLQDVGMARSLYNKIFNKTMNEQIRANPACDEFDVTLLFVVIKSACQNLAPRDSDVWNKPGELENHLKSLKDERNHLFHKLVKRTKKEVRDKIEELRALFVSIIETASLRYSVDQTTKQKRMDDLNLVVNQVRDQPLTDAEIQQCKALLRQACMEKTFREKGAGEFRAKVKMFDSINPISFREGFDTHINLQSVFTELSMTVVDHLGNTRRVNLREMLQVASSGNEVPLIMVRGVAGAGKTTLTKWCMLEWAKCSTSIQGLNTYDLVIPLECKSCHADSLTKLIRNLLPNTCAGLTDDDITFILNLKLFFILDGVDEFSASSRRLVQEILHLSKDRHHTLLCTSRKEHTRRFLKTVPPEYNKITLDIQGIPENEQGIFAETYHRQLIKQGKSKESSEDLRNYVEKSNHFQEFYRFPMNLVILVYLWAYRPDQVNQVTTVTELYVMLYDMLVDKLLQRLMGGDAAGHLDLEETEEKVRKFIRNLSMEALISVSLDEVLLSFTSKKRLKSMFDHDDKIQFKDVVSSFLTSTVIKRNLGQEQQLCFPHKGSHDYFAAQGLLQAITDRHFYVSLRTTVSPSEKTSALLQEFDEHSHGSGVIRHVLNMLSKSSVDVTKYNNILKHLAGLLSLRKDGVKKNVTQELVQLFHETGVETQDQWLEVLAETKCDDQTGRCIAESYFSNEDVLEITSARVAGFASLMPQLTPRVVNFDLTGDPSDLPHLHQLLEVVSEKECRVHLRAWQHYQHPKPDMTTDHLLQRLIHPDARCVVDVVMGHLSGRDTPDGLHLNELHVVLSNDQQATAVTSTILQHPHAIKEVRLMPGVSPCSLVSLPQDNSEIHLDLSQVTTSQVQWACQVAQALAANTRLRSVVLPDWSLSAKAGLQLEQDLNTAGVLVDQFRPFSYIKKVSDVSVMTDITIEDSDVEQMVPTLPFTSPRRVKVQLSGDPDHLPHLHQLLRVISVKDCRVELTVKQHFMHPLPTASTDTLLQCLVHPHAVCVVDVVMGHLSGRDTPVGLHLNELHVVLSSDHQATAVTSTILQHPHPIKEVRVMPGVSPCSLVSLPQDNSEIHLDLSQVTTSQVQWACQVAQALAANTRLRSVVLPDWSVSAEAGLQLEQDLNTAGVLVDQFRPFSYIEVAGQLADMTDITVKDDTVEKMLKILPFVRGRRVTVLVAGDPHALPHLHQLLHVISANELTVYVRLLSHYHHNTTSTGTSDNLIDPLLHQNTRCRVEGVCGHITAGLIPRLPATVKELWVAITSDTQATTLLPALHTLSSLTWLHVHITSSVPPASVSGLPDVARVVLVLSGVGKGGEGRAVDMTRLLQPPGGYYGVDFPCSRLGLEGWQQVVEGLGRRKVRINGAVCVPEACITKQQEAKLRKLAARSLKAEGLIRWNFIGW